MEVLQQLEASRANYRTYGAINPEDVFEQEYDEETGTVTCISVRELVDKVNTKILVHKMREENPLIRIRVR